MIQEEIKKEITNLIEDIKSLCFIFAYKESLTNEYNSEDEAKYEEVINDYNQGICDLSEEYTLFYTKACRVVSCVLPERLEEFKSCYIHNSKTAQRFSVITIWSYFNRISVGSIKLDNRIEDIVYKLLKQQKNILKSCLDCLDKALYDIEVNIQYQFYTDELETARYLLSKKYIRPAGVIAGVALENHLKSVCKKYPTIKVGKNDTLSKYFDYLKSVNAIDVTLYKKLLYLADIRNLCCHSKDREPSNTEVEELINGVAKILVDVCYKKEI